MSDSPPRTTGPAWTRLAALVLVVLSVGASALVVYRDGRFPAAVPPGGTEYSAAPLFDALQAVDSRGVVDLGALAERRVSLDRYVTQLAWASPRTQPNVFTTAEERLAFWLNAYHALVLQALLDEREAFTHQYTPRFHPPQWRSWPIGGQRMTLASIERRYLAESGDPRVYLATFNGQHGHALLEAVPFSGETLDGQLNDAARRFVRRRENVELSGTTVKLSPVFRDHEADFLAALPEGRRNVLQLVWAFLPESCEGERPGCDTRGSLDKACGPKLEGCRVEWQPASDRATVPETH